MFWKNNFESTLKSQKIKNATIPRPRDQCSKLHKRQLFNGFILVRFCVFVFYWQKDKVILRLTQ